MKHLFALLLSVTILFSCTKQEDDISAREQDIQTTNIIVDYRAFPAHAIYTITNEQTGDKYIFDSDSTNYFERTITEGTYQTKWQILGITENKQYKAKMLNENQGTLADWKPATISINGHYMKGTFTFSKVPR